MSNYTTNNQPQSKNSKNWTKKFVIDSDTKAIKPVLINFQLILDNDPDLAFFARNEFTGENDIIGQRPWFGTSKTWVEDDTNQLKLYVSEKYRIDTHNGIDGAVENAAMKRAFHPVKDYIKGLPQWDGVQRLEYFLIDYLGADDTEYVRAVTRKSIVALLARILNPGVKHEEILVLSGPQGIGKTTILRKLGMAWYDDSVTFADMADGKKAAEKLSTAWLVEIAELSGMRKSESECVKAFMSMQSDKYRPAYAKRAVNIPRHCVFFGTVNPDEKGFLRDTTGNRRWWPVDCKGNAKKDVWTIDQDLINQIYAEAMVYYKNGENLYLDTQSLIEESQKIQNANLEVDSRIGIVSEYINMLLPDRWDEMSIMERRDFIEGRSQEKGTRKRESISVIEIWAECFGNEATKPLRAESNTIVRMIKSLGMSKCELKRIKHYGPQKMYSK